MENSKKAVEEVVLGEEQLEAVVGGASRILRSESALTGLYAEAFVARRATATPALRAALQVESVFGSALVTRLDRGSLLTAVVAN
jgi:hypothetical protein